MKHYLTYKFKDSKSFVSTYDELPLWSAPFGLLLLNHVELRSGLTVVDLGCGAGFPLIELAERLGPDSTVYGIDPWGNAGDRVNQKIKNYGIAHVKFIQASAAHIPLADGSVDLIVSNLGVNNFANPETVFVECFRVLKKGGKLVLTTNLRGHWEQFYKIFYSTLQQHNKAEYITVLKKEEEQRRTIEGVSALFTDAGFAISRCIPESFEMNFLNGTSFLNHHFIKLGWLTSWLQLFPKRHWKTIFGALEKELNDFAEKNTGLRLTVPMAFVEGRK